MKKVITLTENELKQFKKACGQFYILWMAINNLSKNDDESKAELLGLDSLAANAHESSWRLMCELESKFKEA